MYVCIRAIYYIILCCNIHHLWAGNLLFFLNHAAWRHRVLMVDGVDGRVFRLRIPAVSSWTFWWLDELGSSWENDSVKRADPLNHGFWECVLEVCFPSYWREDSPCDFYNKTVSAAFQNVFFASCNGSIVLSIHPCLVWGCPKVGSPYIFLLMVIPCMKGASHTQHKKC